jgi:hypothetical protein
MKLNQADRIYLSRTLPTLTAEDIEFIPEEYLQAMGLFDPETQIKEIHEALKIIIDKVCIGDRHAMQVLEEFGGNASGETTKSRSLSHASQAVTSVLFDPIFSEILKVELFWLKTYNELNYSYSANIEMVYKVLISLMFLRATKGLTNDLALADAYSIIMGIREDLVQSAVTIGSIS